MFKGKSMVGNENSAGKAADVLTGYMLSDDLPLFTIGSFEKGVTVLNQQTRALNLAWSLIETKTIRATNDGGPPKIAIVGAGFSGLTFAAALIQKEADCEVYLFEQRDSLLPIQQGSDTRWLHPHIYDWPSAGSEASAAMLPILNWTAARSSDVVVQVLSEWKQILEGKTNLQFFCNARHLQIAPCSEAGKARVEWVGEKRNPQDGTTPSTGGMAEGAAETFDIVVLAVGFGVETAKASYWRNETFGQPSLNEPRRTYLVSGQGDGAMIDLLRIRISQFRQDRILEELFGDKPTLVEALRTLRQNFEKGENGLFEKFEAMMKDGSPHEPEMKEVTQRLNRRLRRDTDAVLQLRVRNISELLEAKTSRMSFQNAVLVYLLYRCGGFAPTAEDETKVQDSFAISEDATIKRHGVRPLEQLRRMVPTDLFNKITKQREKNPSKYAVQSAKNFWPGGYFGYAGREEDTGSIGDEDRRKWRKEFLPGPTSLVATTVCGAIVGAIEQLRPRSEHFRVTLHRTISIHSEELLQQSCDYLGHGLEGASSTAGRTFPATAATIGAAYTQRKIVRTRNGITEKELSEAMENRQLKLAARKMKPKVRFTMAMPLIQPDKSHFGPSPVAAVLYIDSRDEEFWLADHEVDQIRLVFESSVRAICGPLSTSLGRIRNFALEPLRDKLLSQPKEEVSQDGLETLLAVEPPSTNHHFVFNFDVTA